jgi:hypothetical protein
MHEKSRRARGRPVGASAATVQSRRRAPRGVEARGLPWRLGQACLRRLTERRPQGWSAPELVSLVHIADTLNLSARDRG